MSDARALLERITSFRRRLEEHAQATQTPTDAETARALEAAMPLEQKAEVASRQQAAIDRGLRQLNAADPAPTAMPQQLTARARRLVEESRGLVVSLRRLADEPLLAIPNDPTVELDPLALLYRESVAMTESALRLVGTFPDTPSVQLRLCDGVDGILAGVRARLAGLQQSLESRQGDIDRVDALAGLLIALESGPTSIQGFVQIGEALLAEAWKRPIRFLAADPRSTQEYAGGMAFPAPARSVASHALTVASVVAHLVRRDPEWRSQPLDPVVTALMQDVGMLRVPPEVLATAGPIPAEHRRLFESHPRVGAECVLAHLPEASRVVEGIASHHERLDGTGYPMGLKGEQVAALPRLLAVADVYAAMCAHRPHRPAHDPRTALTDTLLMAERGSLDRDDAERLLQLSFYPVGTVVELSDGSAAMVVANHTGGRDVSAPLKPVLAVLTAPGGELLPYPHHVDLVGGDGFAIVRTLPRDQRRKLIGMRYPEWA